MKTAFIALALAVLYPLMLTLAIGYSARVGLGWQTDFAALKYALPHLLAVLIAALPVALVVVSVWRQRAQLIALLIAVPTALLLTWDIASAMRVAPQMSDHVLFYVMDFLIVLLAPTLLTVALSQLKLRATAAA